MRSPCSTVQSCDGRAAGIAAVLGAPGDHSDRVPAATTAPRPVLSPEVADGLADGRRAAADDVTAALRPARLWPG
ncbi:hypothetical protein ACI8AG_06840 [Blastococcus sp. SYSU DS0552]